MFLNILGIFAVVAYAVFNIIVAYTHSTREMREEFIEGQCVAGMIFANLFYAPAWVLKIIRGFVMSVVK